MGSLFAAALHHSGTAVTLLTRNSKPGEFASLEIQHAETTTTLTLPTSPTAAPDPIRQLLVTTKSYAVHAALRGVSHRLGSDSLILILVNGMGFMPAIHSEFPHLRFALGTTTEGAYRIAGNRFCHAGTGVTLLGQDGFANPPPWFDSWRALDICCRWEVPIEPHLWRKLAINCAINPLSALQRCPNGQLGQRPDLRQKVRQLCDEIARVSAAAGFADTAATIHEQVAEVIKNTAANRSSMLQDVLAGRPTENRFITGYFLQIARQHGIDTPANARLYADICTLENPA